jgi:predicted RNase H-like HicB family nuclease
MPYSVTLERGSDGGYMAWVHELPGCFARGRSKEEVEGKLAAAIEEFTRWLRAGGEPVPSNTAAFQIVDEVDTPGKGADADSDVLLHADREPLTAEQWATVERWLRLSRADLLRALRQADERAWDWKPEGAPRSVREHAQHVVFVEFMYAAWTFDHTSRQGMTEFLRWTRTVTRARMRELAARGDMRLTHALWGGAARPEPWTARKAARRLVWHELLHTRAVTRLLKKWQESRRNLRG